MLKVKTLISDNVTPTLKMIITENQFRELCNRLGSNQQNNQYNIKPKSNEQKK